MESWKALCWTSLGYKLINRRQSSHRLDGPANSRSASPKRATHTESPESQEDDRTIADVVLITGLSLASENIQIQALEVSH